MIHYHGTPINPQRFIYDLAGHCFCVSFADPRQIKICHEIGQSVLIDCGEWTFFNRNKIQTASRDWRAYYAFTRQWLDFKTTWCVIPDRIKGSEAENDHLLAEWFAVNGNYRQASPVWHLHESFERLDRLVNGFERVCFGSSGEYLQIGSVRWNNRMNEAFNRICKGSGTPPCWIHMLRGMSLSGSIYPFASVDSTDVARNHEQAAGWARAKADEWDCIQCPARWEQKPLQQELEVFA